MAANVLLSANGNLNASALDRVPLDVEETTSVVAALSAHGLGQSAFLDSLFSTSFSSGSDRKGIATAYVAGDDSAAITEPLRGLVVLDVECFDGVDRARTEARERASHLALLLADVVLFSARMNDLGRVESNGMSALRASITEMLRLHSSDVLPLPTAKRAFVLVVKDYEEEVLSREELISGFLQEMQRVYDAVARPPRSPTRIRDIYAFEFVTMPSAVLLPQEYSAAVSSLRTRLLDPVSNDYFFERGLYARETSDPLPQVAQTVWNSLEQEQLKDIPPPKELTATFDCDNAMRKVFEKYQRSVQSWRRQTDAGSVIDSFGTAATKVMNETLAVFAQDTGTHRNSKAFRRKKEELRDLLDADLYSLFVKQIAKLRETTYRNFKDSLRAIAENDRHLERKVNSTLKDCQKSFKLNAEKLRPRATSWRFDNDMKELATQMREDATERLQRARLADYQENGGRRRRRREVPRGGMPGKPRQPVSVSFHYLDPAPFGLKDSRYEKLNVDDAMDYNPPPRHSKALVGAPVGNGKNLSDGISVPLLPPRGATWNRYG